MSHLDLIWNKVKTPDPTYTKSFKRGGGFNGTGTNTQYSIQVATELWGLNGQGWGVTIDDEAYVEGAPLIVDNAVVGREIIHIIKGHLWYLHEGEKYQTSQQFGQTTFVGKNKYGPFTDEEAPKKSVTDMMLKCMSLLGFSADIFLGKWDDNKYVNDVKKKFEQPKQPTEKEKEVVEWKSRISAAKTAEEFTSLVNRIGEIDKSILQTVKGEIHKAATASGYVFDTHTSSYLVKS